MSRKRKKTIFDAHIPRRVAIRRGRFRKNKYEEFSKIEEVKDKYGRIIAHKSGKNIVENTTGIK